MVSLSEVGGVDPQIRRDPGQHGVPLMFWRLAPCSFADSVFGKSVFILVFLGFAVNSWSWQRKEGPGAQWTTER